MMRKLLWLLTLVTLSQTAFALKLKSLNSTQVLVTSQSDQQRDQAIKQAFVQTLSKMSGSADILKNPDLKAAVPNAQRQVEEYGYVPSGIPGTPYYLNVQFDARAMKRLLRQAGAPIWDANRPLILVWMAAGTGGKAPEVIDNQLNNEYGKLLKTAADQRGLPILLPMMDISELNLVSAEDIRQVKADDDLRKASQRYHSDGILIGGIEQNSKIFQGHWKLIVGDEQWDWNLSSNTAAGLIDLLTNKIVSVLADRYAAVQTEKVSSPLTLVVKGVAQHDDFENMMHFLKHISMVKEMEIENIDGDSVVLSLAVQGAQTAFMQDASVGQHLKLELEDGQHLTYAWVP